MGVEKQDEKKIGLKPLFGYLTYAYLEDGEKFLVIISFFLNSCELDKLLGVIR